MAKPVATITAVEKGPEDLQLELQKLVVEATRISATDPNGASRLLRAAQNLMKTQGVALHEKTLAKMDVHKQEIVEVFQDAYNLVLAYVAEHNLPAMNVQTSIGFSGSGAEGINGTRFSWASSSMKPVRISIGHKRTGTLSKDGKEIGKFDSATAAAKAQKVALESMSKIGNMYSVPATKALKDAGYIWNPDPAEKQ